MGILCRIYIRNPQEHVFRAGQTVSGILSYTLEKPTEFQVAVLSLKGKARCKWSERHGKTTHTYTGKEVFLAMYLNILNKPLEETVTLAAGTYEFQFEFILPFEIPSSFEDKHSNIIYKVKATFEKPSFFSHTKKFEKLITVYSYVNATTESALHALHLTKELSSFCCSTEQIVDLKMQIDKTLLSPGEKASLNLCVSNQTDKEIYLTAKLRSSTRYVAEGAFSEKVKIDDKTIEGCTVVSPPILGFKSTNFTCGIPTLTNLYSVQYSDIVSKKYFVQITIHLPFPHRNAKGVIPIVIGESLSQEALVITERDDNIEPRVQPSPSAPSDGDLPPSYWQVMNEKKPKDKTKTGK